MKVAFLGCGYVADFYMATITNYKTIELVGVFDKDKKRLEQFCSYYNLPLFKSFDDLKKFKNLDLVINLTNPRDHYHTTKEIFNCGKHVYLEKPIAMTYKQAKNLFNLAKRKNLYFGCAPCSYLSNTAQTLHEALKNNIIGDVKLIIAKFDAGMTHKQSLNTWVSKSGAPWPAKDEFEVGCTYEHAGYFLTWLAHFFGPAKFVSSFSSIQIPNKGINLDVKTPDYSSGIIKYSKNIVANVSCSIIAPLDRSISIVGSRGTLYVRDIRDDNSPVYVTQNPGNKIFNALEYRFNYWVNKFENLFNYIPWNWGLNWRFKKKYKSKYTDKNISSGSYKPVDFCKGINDLINAIETNTKPKVSSEIGVHVNEIIEVLQYPERFNGSKKIKSKF